MCITTAVVVMLVRPPAGTPGGPGGPPGRRKPFFFRHTCTRQIYNTQNVRLTRWSNLLVDLVPAASECYACCKETRTK